MNWTVLRNWRRTSSAEIRCASQLRKTFIRVRQWAGSGKVGGFHFLYVEPGLIDQIVDLAIQMTAAADASPKRSEPVLPLNDGGFGRSAVFDEQKSAILLKYALHLRKGLKRIRYRAQSPCDDDCVNAGIAEWEWAFGRLQEQVDVERQCGGPLPGHFLKFSGWINAENAADFACIERQVET